MTEAFQPMGRLLTELLVTDGTDWYVHAYRNCDLAGCEWQLPFEWRRRKDSFDWRMLTPIRQDEIILEHLKTHPKEQLEEWAARGPMVRKTLQAWGLIE